MSITRAGIEAELVAKLRGKLSNGYWQLSLLTNGSNPDLNGPIRRAVLSLGGAVAGGLMVADADLAAFSGWDLEKLLDVARLEILKVCMDQSLLVDVQVDSDKYTLSQIIGQVQSEIAYLEQRMTEPYGPNVSPAVVSQMTGQYMPNDPFAPCQSRSARGHWPYP